MLDLQSRHTLTPEDAKLFAAALDAPPAPTPRALEAARNYGARAWFMPTKRPAYRIEHFDPARHDRADFDCGVARLNNYLKLSAKKQQKDDMTRVYVAVEEGSPRILGYHAINFGMMNVDQLKRRPRGTPDHGEIPVLFLGQVAGRRATTGQRSRRYPHAHHVFEKACVIADAAGCHAIILDVISDGGEAEFARRRSWYESFGFATFVSNPARMFLAMKQVRAVVQASSGSPNP